MYVRRGLQVYTTGTITNSSGSAVVTGSGTSWITTDADGLQYNNVVAGDIFKPGPLDEAIPIKSVDSATQLTLEWAPSSAVTAGSAYRVLKYIPNPTGAVLKAMETVETLFTDDNPAEYFTVDDGASRFRVFVSSGVPTIGIGDTGTAEGSLIKAIQFAEATGYAGFGTNAPTSPIDVYNATAAATLKSLARVKRGASGVTALAGYSDLLIESDQATFGLAFAGTNTSKQSIIFGDPQDADQFKAEYDHATNLFALELAGVKRFRWDGTNGKLGIGNNATLLGNLHVWSASSGASAVSTSADELVIEGSGAAGMSILAGTSADASIFFGDSASQTIGRLVYTNTTDSLAIWTNSASRMTFASDGKVGVGTTSPAAQFHVKSSSLAELLRIQAAGTTGNAYVAIYNSSGVRKGYVGYASGANDGLSFWNDLNDAVYFGTNGATRIAIAGDGTSMRPGTDNALSLGTGSFRFSTVYAATGTINTSDEREKTDIKALSDSLPSVLPFLSALRPVSFRYKVGGRDVEMIDQEVTETAQAMQTRTIAEAVEAVEDGKIVQRYVTRDVDEPVFDELLVFDVDGNPVMDGEQQATRRVPRMIEQTIIKKVEQAIDRPGKRLHLGLIAQEVKGVIDAVNAQLGEPFDFGGYVYDPATDHHGLRYDQFIAVLIRAVQELSQKLNDVNDRVETLEVA